MTTGKRRFAHTEGINITYQVTGQGPDLVLHHGFSRFGNRWRMKGYVDQLVPHFRLILIDARGHGASDKPHEPAAYGMEHRLADVQAVMDAEGIDSAHHWGYSMGGQVCFRLAATHPERIGKLVIGGMHPYARAPEPLTRRIEALRAQGVAGFTGLFEGEFGRSSDAERDELRENDPLALAAATQTIRDTPATRNDDLRGIDLPTLIYCGSEDVQFLDGARRAANVIGATFVEIPGSDHMTAQNPDLVAPIVWPFFQSG